MAHEWIQFGNTAVNPALVCHAVWKETGAGGCLEIHTSAGTVLTLPLSHEDIDRAAKAVGLAHCCKAKAAAEKPEPKAHK